MSMPLWSRSAAELLPELHSGALKAETLVQSVLGQIEARNAPVNAFSHVATDSALEAARVPYQELPSPHRAVRAVPGAVEDRPHRPAGLAVLRQTGGEVGVVVLHANGLNALTLEGVLGGEVLRV